MKLKLFVELFVVIMMVFVALPVKAEVPDTLICSVVNWSDDGTFGRWIHRDYEPRGLVENEFLIGRQMTPKVRVYIGATVSNRDAKYANGVLQVSERLGRLTLTGTLDGYLTFDQETAPSRAKLWLSANYRLDGNWSIALQPLGMLTSGSKNRYFEIGPVLEYRNGRTAVGFQPLWQDGGARRNVFTLSLAL